MKTKRPGISRKQRPAPLLQRELHALMHPPQPLKPFPEKRYDWTRPLWLRRFARWVLFGNG